MLMQSFDDIWAWIFHVPSTYEMLWWVMLVVVWYGFVIDRRTKIIQQQLEELAASKLASHEDDAKEDQRA